MELVDFYQNILESTGLKIGEKGEVFRDDVHGLEPYTVVGKELVLPTSDFLKNPNWEKNVAFHPICENIARKDSPVLQSLQHIGNIALNIYTAELMGYMIDICADHDKQPSLNHKQTAVLTEYPDADETAAKNFDKLQLNVAGEGAFVKIYTLRNKELDGQKYARVTYVKFPFYDELMKLIDTKPKAYELYGVKIRKRDAIGYAKLFEYIFKHLDNVDVEYSSGTRALIAPSLHSFLLAFGKVMKELERVYRLFKIDFPSLRWTKALDNFKDFKNMIPALPHNEGELTEGDRRRNELELINNVTNSNQTQPTQPQPTIQQPQQAQVSTQKANLPPEKKLLSFGEMMKKHQQQQYGFQQPQPMQMPNAYRPMAVQPQVQQPMVQPTVQQPVQPVVNQQIPQQQMPQQPIYPNQQQVPPQYGMQQQMMQQPMMQQSVQPQGMQQAPQQPPVMRDGFGRPVQRYQAPVMYDAYGRPIQQMPGQMYTGYPQQPMMNQGYNGFQQPQQAHMPNQVLRPSGIYRR